MKNKVRILLYHRIEDLDDDHNMLAVKPRYFYQHMKYLKDNFGFARLSDPIDLWHSQDRDTCIITFDDGYYDFYKNAVPILQELDIPSTIFITTGLIDKKEEMWTDILCRSIFSPNRYQEYFCLDGEHFNGIWMTSSLKERMQLYTVLRGIFQMVGREERKKYEHILCDWAGIKNSGRENRRIMSSKEILAISKIKNIDVGAHCVTHPSLRLLPDEEQREEICESKIFLEKIIGRNVKLFSFPFGTLTDYSMNTIRLLKESGFDKAVVGWQGSIDNNVNPYELPRYGVRNYDLDGFKKYIENVVFGNDIIPKSDNRKNIISGKRLSYVGYFNDDLGLLDIKDDIVIWGTGETGKKIFHACKMHGIDNKILCFGDNNSLAGDKLYGFPILSLEEILKVKSNKSYLIAGWYAPVVIRQLQDVGENNIRWEYI